MRAGSTVVGVAMIIGLMFSVSGSAFAKSTSHETTVRKASVMRAKAAELRDQANHLRDGEGVNKPNVAQAKKLEREADQLERQADKTDPQDWPPK
jgi:uncharacterized sporulation protein YeaH/YhbH (DUF444 family)